MADKDERLRQMVAVGTAVYGVVRFLPCDCGDPQCQGVRPLVIAYTGVAPPGDQPTRLGYSARAVEICLAGAHHVAADLEQLFGAAMPDPPGKRQVH
jgi:hypothetical protein